MKKSTVILAMLLVIMCAVSVMAKESVLPPNINKTLVEDNLFVGMASDNLGLQRSCALLLGKIQSDRAVVPLMAVLHTSTDEYMRIAAAWALCNIGDARGAYAVKMAVKYDISKKVQATCAWYYENLVKQGTFSFSQPDLQVATTTE
jgi:HEAT repeat protein